MIHEDSPDKYTVVDTVPTRKYARTMAIDLKTHNIFLPIAEFEPVAPKGEEEPPMKPDSFGLLLVAKWSRWTHEAVSVGIIGTGWGGGIRTETCAASPFVLLPKIF